MATKTNELLDLIGQQRQELTKKSKLTHYLYLDQLQKE